MPTKIKPITHLLCSGKEYQVRYISTRHDGQPVATLYNTMGVLQGKAGNEWPVSIAADGTVTPVKGG